MQTGKTRKTVINAGECIFERFYDPALSSFKKWTVGDGAPYGLKLWQSWCYVMYEWARQNDDGPEIKMERPLNLECHEYDALTVSLVMPLKSALTIALETDAGLLRETFRSHDDGCKEYNIELKGAKLITHISVEIKTESAGPQTGWLNWMGLVNHGMLERSLLEYSCWDSEWEGYIVSEGTPVTFDPQLRIIVTKEELKALREKGRVDLIMRAAEKAAECVPEEMIHGYMNLGGDTRYNRDRDHGKILLNKEIGACSAGVAACTAGVLKRDEKLLRLAARYAMSIAVTKEYDNPICCYPGGVFEHRSFTQSICAYDLGFILDLAGELFTDAGKELIRRRIAERLVANINFITWKFEYIFECNQLAIFSPGRLMGYAALLPVMPRVSRYIDIAIDELRESVEKNILSDGGYVEGPLYFSTIGVSANLAFYIYARIKGLDFKDVLPESIKKTAAFAEAIFSTDEKRDYIPICDSGSAATHIYFAFMAYILPDSQWTRMYHKLVARNGGGADSLLGLKLDAEIKKEAPKPAAFTLLPEMRLASSYRELDGEPVKLLVMGNHAHAGHTHEDKGSFTLEFAGETFATDPGSCDYSDPFSFAYKTCQYHNMLIPFGMAERPAPESPCPGNVDIIGHGNETGVDISVSAGIAWKKYFVKWDRRFSSPHPGEMLISDDYELDEGDGVCFNWLTELDVKLSGCTALIEGRRGAVEVAFPNDCVVSLERLPLADGGAMNRIVAARDGKKGTISVRVALRVR